VVSGATWPELVRCAISERDGVEAVLVDRQFVPIGERAPDVAERAVWDAQPDVVLLPLGEFAFWAQTVQLRVRRLFGRRVASWFKTGERRFERATGKRGGIRRRVNRSAKWVGRHVIGAEGLASPKQVTETYRETFARLARIENVEVVVVAYPVTPMPALRQGRLREARERFIAELRREATTRHFHWVGGDELIAAAGLTPEVAYATDQVHIGEPSHAILADAITAALRPSLASTGR
jgi:hypothetical protein